MMTPEEIRDLIMATQPSGTLRIWGDWFGRPYDNAHRIVSVAVDADTLLIGMDGDELLSVMRAISNIQWYMPSFSPSLDEPAVEPR